VNTPPFDIKEGHRWFAIALNNSVWDALESTSRSAGQDMMIVHAAHASCYHWLQAGGPEHHARAECLVANVYAMLGNFSAALQHGNRCLQLIEKHSQSIADWDRAFAYDCLARATAAAGQSDEARQLRNKAQQLGETIVGAEERKVFLQWFASGNWHGISEP